MLPPFLPLLLLLAVIRVSGRANHCSPPGHSLPHSRRGCGIVQVLARRTANFCGSPHLCGETAESPWGALEITDVDQSRGYPLRFEVQGGA